MADPVVRPAAKDTVTLEDYRRPGTPVLELHVDRAVHRLGSRMTISSVVDGAEMEIHQAGVLVKARQPGGSYAVVLVPWPNVLDVTLAAPAVPGQAGVRLR